MSFIKGAVKIAKGVVNIAKGSGTYDGVPQHCKKCGGVHVGACPEYRDEGEMVIKEYFEKK